MDTNTIRRRISDSVIEARVRRALAREGEVLCKPRGERMRQELGDYFTVDPHTGNPVRWHLHLNDLARECHVLRPGDVGEYLTRMGVAHIDRSGIHVMHTDDDGTTCIPWE